MTKTIALTVCTENFAGLPKEQDSIGRGYIKLQPLRSVLDQLSKKLEHRCGDLGVVAPDLNASNQNTRVGGVTERQDS